MFWETAVAVFLMVTTSVLWVLVAVAWGLFQTIVTFLSAIIEIADRTPTPWSDLWMVPVDAVLGGLEAAWSVPISIWHWAKFEHPWWAFGIGVLSVFAVSYERR